MLRLASTDVVVVVIRAVIVTAAVRHDVDVGGRRERDNERGGERKFI
jgi:hypothetical protein